MKNHSTLSDVHLEVFPGDLVGIEIFISMDEEKHKI